MSRRKDVLAAGARSATFMGGIGENDVLRNVAKGKNAKRNKFVPEAVAPIARKKFTPRGTTVLVRRTEIASTSLLVTETMEKEQPAEGFVLEVGPEIASIAVGDNVVFGKYAGAEFKLNGETLLLMEADEIKGTLVNE